MTMPPGAHYGKSQPRICGGGVANPADLLTSHHNAPLTIIFARRGRDDHTRRGWRRAARVLFDLADVPPIGFDDFAEARAVKRDYQAARELVNLAKSRPAP